MQPSKPIPSQSTLFARWMYDDASPRDITMSSAGTYETFNSVHICHIFLLSSALRISVLKNRIISTKLSTLMSAGPISTCHPRNSDERSKQNVKHTFVDRMDIVRRRTSVCPILVIVSDDVAREIPVISRICGPHPIYVNLVFTT